MTSKKIITFLGSVLLLSCFAVPAFSVSGEETTTATETTATGGLYTTTATETTTTGGLYTTTATETTVSVADTTTVTTVTSTTAAAAGSVDISISIADAGKLVVTQEALTVTDADADGSLTINDALILSHDKFYEGGAAAGYSYAATDWGLSITKLWGKENNGSFGYTVNDTFANSLSDILKSGDRVYAYCYQDAEHYTDMYTYFDKTDRSEYTVGDEIELTLMANTFDESWKAVQKPVADAVILIDGKETAYKTGADGKVKVKTDKAGQIVISAANENSIIVPPVYKATVKEKAAPAPTGGKTGTVSGAKTGDTDAIPALVIAGLLAAGTAFMMRRDD